MLVLTKNIIKEIRSLEQRKCRREQSSWLAEGNKMVGDLLAENAFPCRRIVATQSWWQEHPEYLQAAPECYEVSSSDMKRVSLLQTPQDVLAVFADPSVDNPRKEIMLMHAAGQTIHELFILLDEVQDPGNLGTIIRTADWFGVRHIFCAPGTADCFSPKVVQATMSALARVQLHYFSTKEEECEWLSEVKGPIYGTFLEGENIYSTNLLPYGVLVMGNEGRGISPEVTSLITDKILIPHFAPDGKHVESLNVSIATAICLSEFKRR